MTLFVSAVIVLVTLATPSFGEVLTWNCIFNKRIDESGLGEEKMRLVFKVDTVTKKAFMEGNIGFVEVDWHIGDVAFSFTEKLASGSVQTTTITKDGFVVHSRNTIMFDEIVAAQHFGRCTYE